MALRLCSRPRGAAFKIQHVGSNTTRRKAATAAATASSNLPEYFKYAIEVSRPCVELLDNVVAIHLLSIPQREASLRNPDPPSDSQTAQLVNDQLPFMVPTYVRPPPMFVKGQGCHLWDIENRRYLDFTAGIAVNALGHCDPEMTKLIAQQVSPRSVLCIKPRC